MQNDNGLVFSCFTGVMYIGIVFAVRELDLHEWFKCLKYMFSIHCKRIFQTVWIYFEIQQLFMTTGSHDLVISIRHPHSTRSGENTPCI